MMFNNTIVLEKEDQEKVKNNLDVWNYHLARKKIQD